MKLEFTNHQQYLLHNLAVHDNAFYIQFLNQHLPTNKQIYQSDADQAHSLFEFLCFQATENHSDAQFTKWLNNMVGVYAEDKFAS